MAEDRFVGGTFNYPLQAQTVNGTSPLPQYTSDDEAIADGLLPGNFYATTINLEEANITVVCQVPAVTPS